MKLNAWWTSYPRKFNIEKIEDTVVPYLKSVTFWHDDYNRFETVVAMPCNIMSK